MTTYKAAIVGGDTYDFLTDLLERMCAGEPVGTDDDAFWAAGMLKYTMVGNTCCDGKHFDGLLKEMGYEKKGGVSHG